jgi:predicted transcriptional regulator
MSKTLGIYVSSDQHLPQLVKLCKAAKRKDVDVDIFFTHMGCSMMKDPLFKELEKVTRRMALCLVCFQEHKGEKPVPGLRDEDYATQERHGDIIDECTRYLNF